MNLFKTSFLLVIIVCVSSPLDLRGQAWRTPVGWEALSEEVGASLEDGTGIDVCQVEAMQSSGGYRPPPGTFEFLNPDKIFSDLSGVNEVNSVHAQSVGRYFYGNVMSMVPGVINVDYYEAENFLLSALGFSASAEPDAQNFEVQNHSWIANEGISDALSQNLLSRLDYAIIRDNITVVAGTTNSGATPRLLVSGYNSISVGRTSGTHGVGATNFYGSGRVKPEIVSPAPTTSRATPMVSGAAVLLRDAGSGTNAVNSEVIKALILAGATKSEFPSWSRSSDVPLDTTFGVGEVNIFNSYAMLQAGETDGQATQPSNPTGDSGWDFGTVTSGQTTNYTIELTEPADHLSIVLTWNIEVTDNNSSPTVFIPNTTLANLDLVFSGNGMVDISNSSNHNIEHVYIRDVPAGIYNITLVGDRTTDFGLAWRSATTSSAAVDNLVLVSGSSSGRIASIATSDNDYFEITPSARPAISNFESVAEFETISSVAMPNAIEFELETQVNTPNIEQIVEVFNFESGEYVQFDAGAASFSDSTTSVEVTGELIDFVAPSTGTIRARVTWRPTGPVLQFPWTARIDQASFNVSQ